MRSAYDTARTGTHPAAFAEPCRVRYDWLREQARKVPEHGYAFSGGEHALGAVFMATPIRKQTGRVITALPISGHLSRFTVKAPQRALISARNLLTITVIGPVGGLT